MTLSQQIDAVAWPDKADVRARLADTWSRVLKATHEAHPNSLVYVALGDLREAVSIFDDDTIKIALAATAPQQAAGGEWVLVPREATETMLDAAWAFLDARMSREHLSQVYAKFIEWSPAAPTPETVSQPKVSGGE